MPSPRAGAHDGGKPGSRRRDLRHEPGAGATPAAGSRHRRRRRRTWRGSRSCTNTAPRPKDVTNAENDLVQAQSEVQAGQAEEEEARKRLEVLGLKPDGNEREVAVRAPIAGKVLEIAVAPGEYRNDTAASLMTVADLSTVWVTSNVPEGSIRLVQLGEPVEIDLVAYPGETFRGRVTRIADVVDAETRTVKVHAELANPAGPLPAGDVRQHLPFARLCACPGGARRARSSRAGRGPSSTGSRQRASSRGSGSRWRPPGTASSPSSPGLRGGERVVADGALLLGGN